MLQQGGLLQVVDQVGISGQLRLDVFNGAYVDIFGDAYLEGDIAYLYSAGEEGRVGGALRLVVPAGQDWAVTAEGGWNDTVLANKSSRRFLVGVQLGLWVRPPHVGAIRSRLGTSGSH